MDLEKQQQLELSALNSEHERVNQLASVPYPKRKTGEMNSLAATAKNLIRVLKIYDVLGEPPAIADLSLSMFAETLARLNELCAPAPSAPAA